MGDTIPISGADSFYHQLNALPPSLRDTILWMIQDTRKYAGAPVDFGKLLLCAGIMAILVYLIYLGKYSGKTTQQAKTSGGYFYNGKDIALQETDIIQILQKYFASYNQLSGSLQVLFVQRLQHFMQAKIFHLPVNQTYMEIPVLLSAAAVQLTFGLPGSLLPWFRYINVTSTEFMGGDERDPHRLAGNVEGHSINIAWNHFMESITSCEDGCNVGLHELAHALYYEYIAVEKGSDRRFTVQLRKVMHEIEAIYRQGQYSQLLFSDYAFRNTQECWAESIELFFEKPDAMQSRFPGLFLNLTQLLQQDPRNKVNPLVIRDSNDRG